MIKIRMAKVGRKLSPIFNIVATNSRSPRDSKHIVKLGQYLPKRDPQLVNVNVEEIKNWISKGAQLSDTVKTILKRNNIKL